jgi:hypothetical protein
MPGIVGLITRMPRDSATRQVVRMVEVLRHDPSHATGMWADECLGVYIGWSVPWGALSTGVPLENERRDLVLAFSGEEFPDPRLRARLRL